jgi:hypothetical protein
VRDEFQLHYLVNVATNQPCCKISKLIGFRHFIGGLLALASLNHACWDHVPAFPQTLTTMVFGHSSLRWLEISP